LRQSLIQWRSQSPEETQAIGERLAASIPWHSDAPTVLYLTGDLGAGKTTLAKGFVRGCGIPDAVRSPTYALLESYEARGFTVVHLDLYRLRDPEELEPLGLRDWAGPRNIWLIEWPEKGGSRLPPADLRLVLRLTGDAHLITATAVSTLGLSWLQGVNMS
jgi:tRNA threonylcarbamoyladenosine biosynthesis protein TsaE